MAGGGAQALKRIPRIKFPQRHPKPTGLTSQSKGASGAANSNLSFFSSSKVTASVGGKASLQPKRTSVSNDEIEAILVLNIFSMELNFLPGCSQLLCNDVISCAPGESWK